MEFFIYTADINDVKKYSKIGIVDGVTTNPALIAKEGRDFKEVVTEMCEIIDGPVSAEVVSKDVDGMIREAKLVSKLHKNIVVKIPATVEGFEALNVVAKEGIKVNFTVLYTANQALAAAKLGATYVSPFVGRLDVTSTGGSELIREIRKIYDNFGFNTKILAASMRNAVYVKHAAMDGADVATIPPNVMHDLIHSELSVVSLDGFLAEWDKLDPSKRNYFE